MKKILNIMLILIGVLTANSCSDDSFPVPPASTAPKFTYTIDNDAFAPATVTFTNVSIVPERAGTVAYTWNFGDGTSSTEVSPIHKFETPGPYAVNLVVVTSSSLEINDVTQTIVVRDPNATGVPLLFTDGGTVFSTIVNSAAPIIETTEIVSLGDSYGMAIDTVANKLYISDYDADKIYIAEVDGTNMQVFRSDVGDPDALVIDYINQLLYWDTSDGIRRADMTSTNTSQFEDVVTGQANDPEGVAIDPASNTIYWNNYSGNVWMKKLSGGSNTQIVTTGGGGAILVIDNKIYFDDWNDTAAEATLRSANLDGTGVGTIAAGITRRIYGMAYEKHDQKLYWGDRNVDTIMRANLDGSAAEPWYIGTSARGLTFGKKK